MLSPDNRTVMISGANRGIGLAIAKLLDQQGYRLSLGVRDTSSINKNNFRGNVAIHEYHANDKTTARSWTERTLEEFGSIEAVVLNAGVLKACGIENGTDEDLDLMWQVNFKGPLHLVRETLPSLKQCGSGRVINLVSLSGKRVMSESNLGYSATKFAALSLTHAIRQSGWNEGVRATSICPGLVDTDMVSQVTTPEHEFKITPDAIAATAAYALSLPNDASVAEILVNSRLEASF